MKLEMTTLWDDNSCYVCSHLPDHKLRMKSCISQTQESCFNLMGIIPTPTEILEHLVDFNIDEVG